MSQNDSEYYREINNFNGFKTLVFKISLLILLQVVYEQEGVFIHSSCGKNDDQDSLIAGILRVIEKVFA